MHSVIRQGRLYRLPAFLHNARVFLVEKNAQAMNSARVSGDAAIAQVEPEEMDI